MAVVGSYQRATDLFTYPAVSSIVSPFRDSRSSAIQSLYVQPFGLPELATNCVHCGASLAGQPRYSRFRVCDECGFSYPISARDRITSLVDDDSFRELEPAL